MRIQIPSEPEREVGWAEIESIKGAGTAKDVRFFDGKGGLPSVKTWTLL